MNNPQYRHEHIGPNSPLKNIRNVFITYWGLWIVLAILFISSAIKIIGAKPRAGEETKAAQALAVPVFGTPEYVGSARCKDCHWKEYDAWKGTAHSKFVQPAGEYSVLGDFENNNRLTIRASKLSDQDITTRMFKNDGKYYVNTIGPDRQFHDYEVAYVIGTSKAQNYITEMPNGELHVLPVEWDVRAKEWSDNYGLKKHYPEDGGYWSDRGRTWQLKCGGCHVTGMKINYDQKADSFKSEWTDLGIGCEACHGPGSNHVKAASVYFNYEKETIVNPAKLPWELRAMVCGQCHNWGESTEDVSPRGRQFPVKYGYPAGYQPGKPLYLYYVKASTDEKMHHQQYNEWTESQHAKAGIMCTNCHDVHPKSSNRQDIGSVAQTKLTQDTLCMNCHQTLQRRGVHRIHTFGSCIACHMPETKGHEHNHTFRFISPEESIRAGGVDKKPNSCSGCHHHNNTPLENLVEFLDAVKKADMPKPFDVHGR